MISNPYSSRNEIVGTEIESGVNQDRLLKRSADVLRAQNQERVAGVSDPEQGGRLLGWIARGPAGVDPEATLTDRILIRAPQMVSGSAMDATVS
jgi:hypothetical protein